jgi:predicted secreted protein
MAPSANGKKNIKKISIKTIDPKNRNTFGSLKMAPHSNPRKGAVKTVITTVVAVIFFPHFFRASLKFSGYDEAGNACQ